MNRMTKFLWFKTIAFALIITFVAFDIAWAYPADAASQSSLSTYTPFQNPEKYDSFRKSSGLLTSALDIANYVFGDPKHGIRELPIDKLEGVLTSPKYGLAEALDGIDLSKVILREVNSQDMSVNKETGVLLIPYTNKDRKYVIQVARRDNPAAATMMGREIKGVSPDYVIKVVRDDYKGETTASAAKDGSSVGAVIIAAVADNSAPAKRIAIVVPRSLASGYGKVLSEGFGELNVKDATADLLVPGENEDIAVFADNVRKQHYDMVIVNLHGAHNEAPVVFEDFGSNTVILVHRPWEALERNRQGKYRNWDRAFKHACVTVLLGPARIPEYQAHCANVSSIPHGFSGIADSIMEDKHFEAGVVIGGRTKWSEMRHMSDVIGLVKEVRKYSGGKTAFGYIAGEFEPYKHPETGEEINEARALRNSSDCVFLPASRIDEAYGKADGFNNFVSFKQWLYARSENGEKVIIVEGDLKNKDAASLEASLVDFNAEMYHEIMDGFRPKDEYAGALHRNPGSKIAVGFKSGSMRDLKDEGLAVIEADCRPDGSVDFTSAAQQILAYIADPAQYNTERRKTWERARNLTARDVAGRYVALAGEIARRRSEVSETASPGGTALNDAGAAPFAHLGAGGVNALKVDRDVESYIMDGMAKAMDDGLAGRPSSLKMIPAYVGAATGEEEGDYFAIDVGGTNLRVLGVRLKRDAEPLLIGSIEKAQIPNSIINGGTAEDLFGFIVNTIKEYARKNGIDQNTAMKLGITWSFPVEQTGVASGIHKEWTKGWDISGVVGQDPVALLNAALEREKIKNVKIVAMCNDTVGTLMFGDIGLILGTGTNAAFPIAVKDIVKFSGRTDLNVMAINSEWGNFDGVPTKEWDDLLDNMSNNPGKQKLEKMISGMYLGEVARHIINSMVSDGALFGGRNYPVFENMPKKPGEDGFTPELMSRIEKVDPAADPDLTGVETILAGIGVTGTTQADRKLIRTICNAVSQRAAKVSASALAAVIKKTGVLEQKDVCRVAIDGSVFKYYHRFKEMIEDALVEIFGDTEAARIKLVMAEDGSGVGAAIIAAVVDRSEQKEGRRPISEATTGGRQPTVAGTVSGASAIKKIATAVLFALFPAMLFAGTFGVPQQPSRVYTQAGDRRIFVQERRQDGTLGSPYAMVMKGVNWSPASTNSNPSADPAAFRQEFFKWYTNDIPLMAQMGVNVTRLYYDMGTNAQARTVLDTFYKYGIKVIMPVTAPYYGDTANSNNIPVVVNALSAHPAIFAWGIGNEWDINYYYETFTNLYTAALFTERCAQTVTALDTNHPTASFYGDPHIAISDYYRYHYADPSFAPWQPTDGSVNFTSIAVNNWAPSVKVWGLQLYRNASFTDAISQWGIISTKPMFVSEFGADSYDHRIMGENQAMQRDFNLGLLDEIYFHLAAERTNGIVSGAFSFEWADEWYKGGSVGVHNASSEINYGQPDSYNDEKWFGLLNISRSPKLAYYGTQSRYLLDGQNGIALVTNPVLKATTGQPAVLEANGRVVFSRSGGDYGGRGLNIAIMNEAGTAVKEYKHFDTWQYRYEQTYKQAVADYLNAIPSGSIVMIAVADHGGLYNYAIDEPIYQALEAMGSTQIRSASTLWAFIAKKGTGKYAETITSTQIAATPAIAPTRDADRRQALVPVTPFVIEGAKMTNGNFQVTFQSQDALVYKIEYTDDLRSGTWNLAFRGLVADGISTSWIDDGSFTGGTLPAKRFYRVSVIDRVIRSVSQRAGTPGEDAGQRLRVAGASSIMKKLATAIAIAFVPGLLYAATPADSGVSAASSRLRQARDKDQMLLDLGGPSEGVQNADEKKAQPVPVEAAQKSEQPRNDNGEYAERPGKSPENAIIVIALSEVLQKGPFDVAKYQREYKDIAAKHPELKFESTIPRSTAVRDLQALVGRGILRPASSKKIIFEVNPKTGISAIAAKKALYDEMMSNLFGRFERPQQRTLGDEVMNIEGAKKVGVLTKYAETLHINTGEVLDNIDRFSVTEFGDDLYYIQGGRFASVERILTIGADGKTRLYNKEADIADILAVQKRAQQLNRDKKSGDVPQRDTLADTKEAAQKSAQPTSLHDFNARSGYRAAAVTGVLSFVGMIGSAAYCLAQGDVTVLAVTAFLAGAYFSWAARRYLALGNAVVSAYKIAGISGPDVSDRSIAQRLSSHDIATDKDAFKNLSNQAQALILWHEAFKSHVIGMLALLPAISRLRYPAGGVPQRNALANTKDAAQKNGQTAVARIDIKRIADLLQGYEPYVTPPATTRPRHRVKFTASDNRELQELMSRGGVAVRPSRTARDRYEWYGDIVYFIDSRQYQAALKEIRDFRKMLRTGDKLETDLLHMEILCRLIAGDVNGLRGDIAKDKANASPGLQAYDDCVVYEAVLDAAEGHIEDSVKKCDEVIRRTRDNRIKKYMRSIREELEKGNADGAGITSASTPKKIATALIIALVPALAIAGDESSIVWGSSSVVLTTFLIIAGPVLIGLLLSFLLDHISSIKIKNLINRANSGDIDAIEELLGKTFRIYNGPDIYGYEILSKNIRPDEVQHLIEYIREDSKDEHRNECRRKAIVVLQNLSYRTPEITSILKDMVNDRNAQLVMASANAIGIMKIKELSGYVAWALQLWVHDVIGIKNTGNRGAVINVLIDSIIKLDDGENVKQLFVELLRDADPAVRYKAARALDAIRWQPGSQSKDDAICYFIAKSGTHHYDLFEEAVKLGEEIMSREDIRPLIRLVGALVQYYWRDKLFARALKALGKIVDTSNLKALEDIRHECKDEINPFTNEQIDLVVKSLNDNKDLIFGYTPAVTHEEQYDSMSDYAWEPSWNTVTDTPGKIDIRVRDEQAQPAVAQVPAVSSQEIESADTKAAGSLFDAIDRRGSIDTSKAVSIIKKSKSPRTTEELVLLVLALQFKTDASTLLKIMQDVGDVRIKSLIDALKAIQGFQNSGDFVGYHFGTHRPVLTMDQANTIIHCLRNGEDFVVTYEPATPVSVGSAIAGADYEDILKAGKILDVKIVKPEAPQASVAATTSEAAVPATPDMDRTSESKKVIAEIEREVEKGSGMSRTEWFEFVQAKIPSQMKSLHAALRKLESLTEAERVVVDQKVISKKIEKVAKKYQLSSEEEMRILRLAVLGPEGQGAGEAVTPVEDLTPIDSRVKQLFEIVESACNNNKAKLIGKANVLAALMSTRGMLVKDVRDYNVNSKMPAAEIRRRAETLMAQAEDFTRVGISHDVRDLVAEVKSGLKGLEADSLVATAIAMARRAKYENQRLIIGLETDWIPGINERGYRTQHDAMNLLIKEIDSLGAQLRDLGLDNVEIVHRPSSELIGAVVNRAETTMTSLSNVIILGSKDTVMPFEESISGMTEEERPFIAAVDPAELKEWHDKNKGGREELNIDILGMLALTLELAAGKDKPNIPMIKDYSREKRLLLLFPNAKPVDYDLLLDINKGRLQALQSA